MKHQPEQERADRGAVITQKVAGGQKRLRHRGQLRVHVLEQLLEFRHHHDHQQHDREHRNHQQDERVNHRVDDTFAQLLLRIEVSGQVIDRDFEVAGNLAGLDQAQVQPAEQVVESAQRFRQAAALANIAPHLLQQFARAAVGAGSGQ
jgi:hypothetical protein